MSQSSLVGPVLLLAVSLSISVGLLSTAQPGRAPARGVDPVRVHRIEGVVRVLEVDVQPGDVVHPGQRLARLDDVDLREQEALVRAKLESSTEDLADSNGLRSVDQQLRRAAQARQRADIDADGARMSALQDAIEQAERALELGWGDGERLAALRTEHESLRARRAADRRALGALTTSVADTRVVGPSERPVLLRELANLEAAIARRTLRAGAAGIVTSVVPAGHWVQDGEAVVSLAATEVSELVACVRPGHGLEVGKPVEAQSRVDHGIHAGHVRSLVASLGSVAECGLGQPDRQLAYITLDAPVRPSEPFLVSWEGGWW